MRFEQTQINEPTKLSDFIREQQSGTRSYSLSPLSKEEEVECETG